MPTIAPRQIRFIRLLVLSALPSCTSPGDPAGYDDTTAGALTTQDDITTATDTPTTTVDDPSTTAGDGGPTSTTSTSDAPGTNSGEMTTMAGSPE